MNTSYVLRYRYQGCYDDGGLGHDVGWHDGRQTIEADTDEEALTKARSFIKNRSGKHPCSSYCGNNGTYAFIGVDKIQHDVEVIA